MQHPSKSPRPSGSAKGINFGALAISLAITLAVGALGGLLTARSVNGWYKTLAKPSFNPPAEVFGPVWTALFILIGTAAYLVWRKRHEVLHWPRIVAVYAIQLILNLMWSFLFFYLRDVALALAEVLVFLVVIAMNGLVFYRVDRRAGFLFIPYFLWVSFAAVLNWQIYILN
ncbi:TspO protein [Pedobacter yulinensis]|uniref:TspO protein n=1 Tax=Pedobacter yulinensis TaxID=2126353 RepID=A0A2T3HHK5_9SPHI|nr:TspO/MBR family protein [Pedobacter yulinensis]PST81936.1 TspO protein [Pedobacter yulinensis]